MLNLLIYNVLGGGESHLYGTEGPLFYLRNGFNNFNVCFVLALLFLGILPISRKKYVPDLLVVISPIYIWLGFMTLQPHKEERFDTFTKKIILVRSLKSLCMVSRNRKDDSIEFPLFLLGTSGLLKFCKDLPF